MHLIERMDQARAAGIDVTADTEFYATGSTSLRSLLPPWALEGGNAEMVERLEHLIDEAGERFDPPTEFVAPGGNEVAARLDVARAVSRRAERSALSAVVDGSQVVPYLNRLSDLLWTLARWQEGESVITRSIDSD